MKKMLLIVVVATIALACNVSKSYAQMMGNATPMMQQSVVTRDPQDLADIQAGKDLFNKFQTKQLSCNQLKDSDFEKIGEYLMNQSFGGNSSAHIQMNNNMKQMMGENGEEQMHIRLAKNATGCAASEGGGKNMMGWGNYGMMGGNGGFLIFPFLIQIVILIDLILVGVWLWKKIQK